MRTAQRIVTALLIPAGMFGLLPYLTYEMLGPLLFWRSATLQVIGIVMGSAGSLVLVLCLWDHAVAGVGSPSLIVRPTRLGAIGFYRLSRNPLYLSCAVVATGEALVLQTGSDCLYAAGVWAALIVGVTQFEEPALRSMLGVAFDIYCSRTPRWFSRKKPT